MTQITIATKTPALATAIPTMAPVLSPSLFAPWPFSRLSFGVTSFDVREDEVGRIVVTVVDVLGVEVWVVVGTVVAGVLVVVMHRVLTVLVQSVDTIMKRFSVH